MSERECRVPVATRITPATREAIERLAAERRTTPGQVARTLIEDALAASERSSATGAAA